VTACADAPSTPASARSPAGRPATPCSAAGRAFENCLALPQWSAARHHLDLIDGTAVFLASDAPPALAVLHRVADGVWYLDQCAGPKNAPTPPGLRRDLVRGLAAAGLRIVAADAQSSLGRLVQEARRGRGRGGIEVDLENEADDDDAFAA
jgi:hypothetical protein